MAPPSRKITSADLDEAALEVERPPIPFWLVTPCMKFVCSRTGVMLDREQAKVYARAVADLVVSPAPELGLTKEKVIADAKGFDAARRACGWIA